MGKEDGSSCSWTATERILRWPFLYSFAGLQCFTFSKSNVLWQSVSSDCKLHSVLAKVLLGKCRSRVVTDLSTFAFKCFWKLVLCLCVCWALPLSVVVCGCAWLTCSSGRGSCLLAFPLPLAQAVSAQSSLAIYLKSRVVVAAWGRVVEILN